MKESMERKPRRLCPDELWASRRAQILDAAVELFARYGYVGADTQMLADKLGVGKGTLYRYFASKEDVFLAAADRVMRRLRQRVEDSMVGIADPLDQIAAAIRAYLAFFAEHPDYVEMLMQERAQFKDRPKPTYFQHREANIERWRDLYRGLIAAGRVRPMPVERITDVLSDLVYGTMFTNYFTGQRKPFEAQAQDILDVVFNGILTPSEKKRLQEREQ